MAKVYLVLGHVPCEADWVEAVYATRELAETTVAELTLKAKFEEYAVDEQEVLDEQH